jgi:phospholipase/carboxylesterase
MHSKQVIYAGAKLEDAGKVLIMLHGRGASAADIISLGAHLEINNFSLVAPQATNNTWYPYSFMAPAIKNEPWLSSALSLLQEILNDIISKEIEKKNIYFLGFSQGACLMLEFVTRHANKYGGIIAFTGGLIGETLKTDNYQGNFLHTPVFIGSSDPDPHVPVSRVQETTDIIKNMHASITVKIYPGMGHTINDDEIAYANEILANKK